MNRSIEIPPFERELFNAQKHGFFSDATGRVLLRLHETDTGDSLTEQMLTARVRKYKVKELLGTLNLVPFDECPATHGELVLGRSTKGIPQRMPIDGLCRGSLVVAQTGAGKSTLVCFLALQIALLKRTIWLTDSYKRSLRRLLVPLRKAGVQLVILNARQWRFNLLQPSGDPYRRITLVVDLLTRILELPPRARMILGRGLHELYTRYGVFQGSTNAYPTLYDLHAWVRKNRQLNQAATDAIEDRLTTLLLGLGYECCGWRIGWRVEDLARHSIVFELKDCSEVEKDLLLQSTLFSLFQREYERGVSNGQLKLALFLEDAQRLLCRSGSNGGELSPLEELAGVIRGSGIGLIALVQSLQGVSRHLVSNLSSKFLGRAGTATDYQTLGGDMGMNTAQVEWLKKNLRPGLFACQLADGSYNQPFLIDVPNVTLNQTVSDAEAADTLVPLMSLSTVPAPEFKNWSPWESATITSKPAVQPTHDLSKTEEQFLMTICSEPGKPVSYYVRLLGISGSRAAAARKKLVEDGWVLEHTVALAQRGRRAVVLEPLEQAKTWFQQKGRTP